MERLVVPPRAPSRSTIIGQGALLKRPRGRVKFIPDQERQTKSCPFPVGTVSNELLIYFYKQIDSGDGGAIGPRQGPVRGEI